MCKDLELSEEQIASLVNMLDNRKIYLGDIDDELLSELFSEVIIEGARLLDMKQAETFYNEL